MGSVVVLVRGRLRPDTARALHLHVVSCWDAGAEVVLDLREADLSVVDAVAQLRLEAGRRGTPLRIRQPTAQVRDLLHLCGLSASLTTTE
ncbi:MAG: STAS domain-containing protein [Mycobacteriales bacterium]